MNKSPPKTKRSQKGWVKTALRLPPELHEELSTAGEADLRGLNSEILYRLLKTPGVLTAIAQLSKQQDQMQATLQEILERLPPKS